MIVAAFLLLAVAVETQTLTDALTQQKSHIHGTTTQTATQITEQSWIRKGHPLLLGPLKTHEFAAQAEASATTFSRERGRRRVNHQRFYFYFLSVILNDSLVDSTNS